MLQHQTLHLPNGTLLAQISLPANASLALLVARTNASSNESQVAAHLANRGYGLIALDLLTPQESHFPDSAHNVPRLAQRLIDWLDVLDRNEHLTRLPLGLYAAGDASPAALRAAAQRDLRLRALVCHNGLIDRAGKQALDYLTAPLLMLIDEGDSASRIAYERATPFLKGSHTQQTLATGTSPALPAARWFSRYLLG